MRDDSTDAKPFAADAPGRPAVRGYLHTPAVSTANGLVLTHGAGGNCKSALLVAVSRAFAEARFHVLRCDLPFRQARPIGPPSPAGAARDRAGLEAAVHAMRELGASRVVLGGLSYGGRQVTMLAAEAPQIAQSLLLFSYPLHPPGRPGEPRIAHLPRLRTPAVFVFGTRDPFGSPVEIREAVGLIPVATALVEIEGAGHDLSRGRRAAAETHREVAARALEAICVLGDTRG